MQYTDGVLACSQLSETLLTKAAIQAHKSDFINQLNYLAYTGRSVPDASYYIDNQILLYNQGAKNFNFANLGTQEVRLSRCFAPSLRWQTRTTTL